MLGASTAQGQQLTHRSRPLPAIDRSVVSIVLEPLGDRLGDPRVGGDVSAVGLLLAKCIETPTTVAAHLALLAEGRPAGGRLMQGICSLLEQLLQQWGLQAFTPPKQLLMIVRQLLEPNKVRRRGRDIFNSCLWAVRLLGRPALECVWVRFFVDAFAAIAVHGCLLHVSLCLFVY